MSSRFEITDSVGNTMTLLLSENWSDYNGRWLPDTTGKIQSNSDWDRNPYYATGEDGHPYNASLETYDSGYGRTVWVMTLAKIIGVVLYESSGTGVLFRSYTLKTGNITWRKL